MHVHICSTWRTDRGPQAVTNWRRNQRSAIGPLGGPIAELRLSDPPDEKGPNPDISRKEKGIMSDPPILDIAKLGKYPHTSYPGRYTFRVCSGKWTDRGHPLY